MTFQRSKNAREYQAVNADLPLPHLETGGDPVPDGSLCFVADTGAWLKYRRSDTSWVAYNLPASGGSGGEAVTATGNVASGVADSGNPVKVGGKYNATPPTLADGNRGDVQVDSAGSLRATLASLISGEDQVFNRMMVAYERTALSITTQTTTLVKAGGGLLGGILIPTPVASATVKIYDNTAASGIVLVDTITLPATLLSDGPIMIEMGAKFGTGLTVVTAGATMAVDVYYV